MKKLGLSLAIAAAAGLSACGGSSGGGSTAASGTTVSGTASKGIVISGLVSAYLFDDAGVPETDAIATATTDSNGDYTLSIPAEHTGKPVYIVVDDNDGAASMKCDIASGCDNDGDGTPDVAFGETLDLATGDLEMTAVLPEVAAEVSVNVTPLTTVAAAVAVDAISTGVVTDFNIQEAVNNANSQVADRFGLMDDVTQIPVVDLTDAAEVAAASASGEAEAIEVAAINAAIISAVQADGTNVSIDEAIESFAEDFVDNGLTDNSVDPTITDLGDILADASDVIEEVVALVFDELPDEEDLLDDIADVGDVIDDELVAADLEEPTDEGDQGTPSDTANATNLAQVKAFVEELRELGTAIDTSMIGEGEGAQSVENILDGFDLQVDAADMASSDDAEAAMEGLASAAGAIIEVYESVFVVDDELVTPTAQHADIYASEDGIAVTVAVNNGVVTLTVDEAALEVELDTTVVGVDVMVVGTVTDITLTDNIVETETSDNGTLVGSIDVDLSGTATSGTIDIEVVNGTLTASATASIDETSVETETSWDDSINDSGTLSNFAFDLDVSMAQNSTIGEADPMSFTGGLAFTFSNWAFSEVSQESEDWSGEGDVHDEHEEITYSPGIVSLDLIGTFGNSTESFDMAFGVDVNGTSIPDLTEIYDSEDGYSETGGEETNSAFATASVTLSFSADLASVADAVDFSFELNRTGYDDGDASLELSYPGRTIMIEAEGGNLDSDGSGVASLTLTNNDGVTMSLAADDAAATEAEELSGTVTVGDDDTIYATFDLDGSIERIVYSDGTFESLF